MPWTRSLAGGDDPGGPSRALYLERPTLQVRGRDHEHSPGRRARVGRGLPRRSGDGQRSGARAEVGRVRLPEVFRDRGHHRLRPREGPNGPRLLLAAGRASARPLPAPGRGGRSHKERPPLRPASDALPRGRGDGSGELLPLQHGGRGGRSAYGARTCPPVPRSFRKMSMMRELYTQILMDHYQRPRNRGELENHDLEEHLLNPLCGDEVTVYARFDGDKVAEVKFTGRGCSISQASASMMTERLVGKHREDVHKEVTSFKSMMVGEEEFPEHDDLAALKGVIKYPARVKCAVLAWTALQNGLEEGGS